MILWINCPIICNHSIPNCPVEFINIRKKDIIKHNNTFLAFISYCNQTDVVLPRKQSSQVDQTMKKRKKDISKWYVAFCRWVRGCTVTCQEKYCIVWYSILCVVELVKVPDSTEQYWTWPTNWIGKARQKMASLKWGIIKPAG